MDKIEHLKKSTEKQQSVFTTYTNSELEIKLSFKLCERMAEKRKPFSDGEFIKNCLTIFTEYARPEKNIWWSKPAFPALLFHAGQMIFKIISQKL